MKYFKVSSKRSCVKFSINALQLGHTSLAENHLGIEEVETLIFELNYADQEKYILEGQRRYREQMNSQYTAGYTDAEEKCKAEIAKKDAEIAEKHSKISKLQDGLLSEKDATIANKDSEIAQLRAELEEYKNMNK